MEITLRMHGPGGSLAASNNHQLLQQSGQRLLLPTEFCLLVPNNLGCAAAYPTHASSLLPQANAVGKTDTITVMVNKTQTHIIKPKSTNSLG